MLIIQVCNIAPPPPHSSSSSSSDGQQRKMEKIKALDRAEAWHKEQARREAREKNRLNKEENDRLILLKAAERQVGEPMSDACVQKRKKRSKYCSDPSMYIESTLG